MISRSLLRRLEQAAVLRRCLNTHRPERTLVTPEWVHENCVFNGQSSNIKLFHVTWSDSGDEFKEGHIAGSHLFGKVDDPDSHFTSMLPRVDRWVEHCENLGIDDDTHVVLYDATMKLGAKDFQAVSAARAWWMFRVFGHHLVSVLDGGLANWRLMGYPINKGADTPPAPSAEFNAEFDPLLYADADVVQAIARGEKKDELLLDTRPVKETRMPDGDVPEDMKHIYGRIRNAVNIPFTEFIDAKTNRYKERAQVERLLKQHGLQPNQKLITHCLAGLRACPVALAAFVCGNEQVRVYDGSWSEYREKGDSSTLLFD